jgi:hypothetical protein
MSTRRRLPNLHRPWHRRRRLRRRVVGRPALVGTLHCRQLVMPSLSVWIPTLRINPYVLWSIMQDNMWALHPHTIPMV